MSLTHTIDYVGVVFSKSRPVGMDIEKPRNQIFKVLNRLCVASEIDWVSDDLEKATILWSAKEAMYKLYGKRKVDFKENLLLEASPNGLTGKIKMPNHEAEHQIYVKNIEEYLLVVAY
jgi:phosphopantetheinyl transferase